MNSDLSKKVHQEEGAQKTDRSIHAHTEGLTREGKKETCRRMPKKKKS